MLEQLLDKLSGTDALTRALRSSDRKRLAEVFATSNVFFLQLPPGCENGLDPGLSQEEFLAHVKSCADDLSQRQQFTPFCGVRDGRKSLLLFTQQTFVQEFAHAYVRRVKRIMPFGVLGISGTAAARLFEGVDSVVFNLGTKHEHELSAEDLDQLRKLLSELSFAHQ
jgi:hypothetical protein